MATWLKQSTAIEIKLGPFVDQTDGFTAETALTIAQADVRLAKNAGDWAQKSETTTLVHEENGWYRCLLDTTDTGTLGLLIVAVNEAGALPVWREFLVVAANVYDALLGGGDLLDVSVTQWLGTAAATPTVAGVPEVDVTHLGGTAQTAGDIIGDTNDIQARLPAALVGGRMASNAEVVGDKTGYALTTAEKEAIISSVSGTADASTITTFDDAARTEADTDYWKDAIVVFTAGPAAGQPRRISAFDPALDRITVATAWTTAPGLNTYLILRTAVAEAPGAGATDWSTAERQQIRDALGVDGTKTTAVGGQLQTKASQASVDTVDDFVDTEVAAIKAKTDNLPASPAATGDAMALTAAAVDAIHDDVYEGTLTLRQITRIVLAAVAGKASGFPAGPAIYRDAADTKPRITATVDADGNRTAVTTDGT